MGVFIIDPRLTVKDTFYADEFNKEVVKQLREYCVELYEVNDKNMAGCKMKIAEDALVIVYNEHDIEHSLIVGVQEFLKKSIEKKAQIWPVAIDRSARIPVGVISKKQSYDVWEQLRCRDLDIFKKNYSESFSNLLLRRR